MLNRFLMGLAVATRGSTLSRGIRSGKRRIEALERRNMLTGGLAIGVFARMLDQTQSEIYAPGWYSHAGESQRAARRLRQIGVGALGAVLILAGIVAGSIAWKVYRVEASRAALTQLGANYFWQHETYDTTSDKNPRWRQWVAHWLGNPVASGLSIVHIQQGHPTDERLGFLYSLKEVRTLVLHSDQATDRTLAVISQLPKLRYLTLVGRRFTIEGLLQLRRLKALERVNIDLDQLSPVEVAVLAAELPNLRVASPRTQPYQDDGYQPRVLYMANAL